MKITPTLEDYLAIIHQQAKDLAEAHLKIQVLHRMVTEFQKRPTNGVLPAPLDKASVERVEENPVTLDNPPD